MDFGCTPAQQQLWDDVLQFARDQLCEDVIARDREGIFPRDAWQKGAAKGILGLYIPSQYGGSGLDMVTTIHAMEALGYGCTDNGFTLAVNGQMWAVQEPILHFGTEAQKMRYLPPLLDGRMIGAHGMTERDSGSNAFALQTVARKVEGGYRLSGEKVYIGMGPIADLILAFATVNPARGRWGITAFLVDARAEGVTQGAPRGKMGLRTNPMGEITFEDVFVADDDRLGPEGAGASIFNAAMQYERSFIFASHVGSMARQLDETVRFVNSREVGGQPISRYQSVTNRLADMKVRLETARHFLYRAAWRLDQGDDATLDAAMAKLVIGENFLRNSEDAIRIHGGQGVLTDYEVERDLRDAMGGVIYSGTSDIQRNLIAGLLGS
ncbi:MAG: acyl-CoA dehydrogenase family protein [Chloroflexi bacterium]|nr:acyl-CoA dehydrogenase family protein [Chloroflexota bacterium]